MIYFIGNIERNICKIGYSKRPYRRITSIQKTVSYPLSIFDIIDGGITDERLIHSLNDKSRISGEWYTLSKIKSLDISKKITTVKVDQIIMLKNQSGQYHLGALVSSINKIKISRNRHELNFSNWLKTNALFIDVMREKGYVPIHKGYAYWGHPFVAVELMRSDPTTKLIAYDNMSKILSIDDPREAVRIGVNENVKGFVQVKYNLSKL